jgi:Predicted sugar phosphatases of the HAD superfamily
MTVKQKLNNYDVYLFDLDGTVYAGDEPIVSTINYINQLIAAKKLVYMVTNNATVTENSVKQKLNGFGINTIGINIVTSAMVTAAILAKQEVKSAYIIGEVAMHEFMLNAGISHDEINPQAVVVSLDRSTTYTKLAKAAEFIQNQQLPFYATNRDLRLPTKLGFLPGAGTLVNLIAEAAAIEPIVIGKPNAAIAEYLDMLLPNHPRSSWIMFGDNYATDILFGINNNIDTCFLETGVHTIEYIKEQKLQPTYIMKTL